jgi:hypothetical protein
MNELYDRKPSIHPSHMQTARPQTPLYIKSESYFNPGYDNYGGDPDQTWMTDQSAGPSRGGRMGAWSEEKVAQLQVRLARKLGPEYVNTRPGPGGGPKLL